MEMVWPEKDFEGRLHLKSGLEGQGPSKGTREGRGILGTPHRDTPVGLTFSVLQEPSMPLVTSDSRDQAK